MDIQEKRTENKPDSDQIIFDEQISARRRHRLQEMKRKKRQQELLRQYAAPVAAAVVIGVILIIVAVKGISAVVTHGGSNRKKQQETQQQESQEPTGQETKQPEPEQQSAKHSESQEPEQQSTKQSEPQGIERSEAEPDGELVCDASASSVGAAVLEMTAQLLHNGMEAFHSKCVNPLGGFVSRQPPLSAAVTERTASFNEQIISENGVLIDVAAGAILARRNEKTRISPASMTKILTVLVAAEHVTDLDDTFTITREITDYSYINDCSSAGFEAGEKVTVRDLFYGTALPSGGDAALGLAFYVAGSQEAFVELMNEKIDALGLADTAHFTNCIGLYDVNHYCTVYDMAVMLKAAYDNSFCRQVLSAHTYTIATTQHPEGLFLSNLFLRRIEDSDTRGEVLCAKTGYVEEAGNCAASLSIGNDGGTYICVTAHSTSPWRCIYDHRDIYQQFLS